MMSRTAHYQNSENYPSITIVTPSFNQGEFIEETILSVLNQNYPKTEYIVIDGGSTDSTLEILKKYDGKLKWISEKDNGQADAVNKGFRMASGSLLGWLNSDDTYEPGCLKQIVECFVTHPELVLVYGNGFQMSYDGKNKRPFISKKMSFNRLAKKNNILQPSVFIKKETLEKTGYLDTDLHFVMDFDLWIRFFKKFENQTLFLPQYLSNWRLHQDTKTSLNRAKIYQEIFDVLIKYYGSIPSSWMVGYVGEILLGYNSSKGVRSVLYQKWPFRKMIKDLVRRFGMRRALLYVARFCVEAPFIFIHRIIVKRSL